MLFTYAIRRRGRAAAFAMIAVALLGAGFAAPGSRAQGTRKDDIVLDAQGHPVAGATVRVCSMPATGQPCMPLANIYADIALTQPLANPLTSDGLGNYSFYAAPGLYEVEISGPQITTKQFPNVLLPGTAGGGCGGVTLTQVFFSTGTSCAGNAALALVTSTASFSGAPGVTPSPTGSTTYKYRVIAYSGYITIAQSSTTTITNGPATIDGTHTNTVTWSAVTGATQYCVFATYPATLDGESAQVACTASLSYVDNGSNYVVPGILGNSVGGVAGPFTPAINLPAAMIANSYGPFSWETGGCGAKALSVCYVSTTQDGDDNFAQAAGINIESGPNAATDEIYGLQVTASQDYPPVSGDPFAGAYPLGGHAIASNTTGTIPFVVGVGGEAEYTGNSSSGGITNLFGGEYRTHILRNGSGTVTNMTALDIDSPLQELSGGSVAITNTYGIDIQNQGGITGQVGTPNALHIHAQTAGKAIVVDSGGGDSDFQNVLAAGISDGKAPITITTAATATLGGTYSSGYTFNQEATAATAITYTLPTAAAGKQYCVGNSYNGSAATTGTISIQTSASGQFIIFTDGTLSATGGFVESGGAAADAACVVGVDATHWQLYVNRGTWTKH